ncbi:MAG TPA: hypothetical protein VMT17_14080 [Anaeromyxobacteraceae bacterium]|nr:hypothetical protein [Anaeromyxobacteraceae bacterium]
MAKFLASLREAVRTALARERLPELPPRPEAAGRPSVARLLLGREELPALPPRPEAERGRSLAAALFAVEPLPHEPPRAPRRRSAWLSWLFEPERIDRG